MKKIALLLLAWLFTQNLASQSIDLNEQLKSEGITVVNRGISEFGPEAIELDARPGDGLALLDNIEFNNGTILIEILGENSPGRSFVGFAFNIQNDSTYEAVYFRPFNFVAKNDPGKSRMSQYIYHPHYPWFKLREERTGEFEGEIKNPPSPEEWFLAKIVLTPDKVIVYVNDDDVPVLEVTRLSNHKSAKIGLWTGNESSGRFRNLTLIE